MKRTEQAFTILSKNQDLENFILISKSVLKAGLKVLELIIELQQLTIKKLETEKQSSIKHVDDKVGI